MKHANQKSCTLFHPWKQNPIQNTTFLPDKYWWSHRHINESIGFYPHTKFIDYKKEQDLALNIYAMILCQELPSEIDDPPLNRRTNEPRKKRTCTVLQHKQDVLKPKQVAQKGFHPLWFVCVFTQQVCNRLKRSQLKRSLVRSLDWSWRQLQPQRLHNTHRGGRTGRMRRRDGVGFVCRCWGEHYSFQ